MEPLPLTMQIFEYIPFLSAIPGSLRLYIVCNRDESHPDVKLHNLAHRFFEMHIYCEGYSPTREGLRRIC